jgi:hypothetical protein
MSMNVALLPVSIQVAFAADAAVAFAAAIVAIT